MALSPRTTAPQALPSTTTFFFLLLCRKQYRKVLECVVTIQKNCRACLLRRRFLHLRNAAIIFQKQFRGQSARRVYRQLLADKREREERRRQEEEERYGASTAGIKPQKHICAA